MPNSDDVAIYTSRPIASDDRLAAWIANDMLALAKLVDEAPDAALADRRVSAALDDLTGSLEAAKRAVASRGVV
jgi:hypothetical protein